MSLCATSQFWGAPGEGVTYGVTDKFIALVFLVGFV